MENGDSCCMVDDYWVISAPMVSDSEASSQSTPVIDKRVERRKRFVKVATRRTRRIIDRLRTLGNCANKGAYEYSPADVDKILAALQHELDVVRAKFEERMKRKAEFKLEL